ncbi:MAG: tRNA (guanine-N1)-methyltransferase [Cyanobacteria bacterium J06641_5]
MSSAIDSHLARHAPDWHTEGRVCFRQGAAFYRPNSRIVRDLGVLAAAVYRQETGHLEVLDAMAATGVRSLRYLAESGAERVVANDANPELAPLLAANLAEAIASGRCQLQATDANRLFFSCYGRQEFFDLVDADSFGSPLPYLTTMFWALKVGGLAYITSTDGRATTGHAPVSSLMAYGAYARAHPSAHEQGLRLILGSAQQQAARQGFGMQPVFAYFSGQTYRVMVRLVATSQLTPQNYGLLGYCHNCGNYQVVPWKQLSRARCPHDGSPPVVTGPLWLGALHDREYLQKMTALAQQWQWRRQANLLEIMQAEATMPPYFFTLQAIGKQGKLDLPKREKLLTALQAAGYRATLTHIEPQAIKTDASLADCVAIAAAISSDGKPLQQPS